MEDLESTIPSKRPNGDAESTLHVPKRSRGRTGCMNCRRRRKRCDETKPSCNKCVSLAEPCEWDTGLTFRSIGIDSSHPSMLQASRKKGRGDFKIVDVKFDKEGLPNPSRSSLVALPTAQEAPASVEFSGKVHSTKCREATNPEASSRLTGQSIESTVEGTERGSKLCAVVSPGLSSDSSESATNSKPTCQRFPYEHANPDDCLPKVLAKEHENAVQDEVMHDYAHSASDTSSTGHARSSSWSGECSASSVTSLSSLSGKQATQRHEYNGRDMDDELTYVSCLEDSLSQQPSKLSSGSKQFHLPAGAVRLLLYRKVEELAENVRSRNLGQGGAGIQSTHAIQSLRLTDKSRGRGVRLLQEPLTARPLGCTKLSKRRQLGLWRNFSHSIAPWLDVCGSRQHFSHMLPLLAKSSDCLHYAVLALSSRQLELKEGADPEQESIDLHDDAARLLISDLHTLDVPVVAACILLCVCDMMTHTVEESRQGLEACAMLLQSANINSKSTGVASSLFWLIANLSAWTSFSELRHPALPIHQYHDDSLSAALSYIRTSTWGEGYPKYAMYLASLVNSVISTTVSKPRHKHSIEDLHQWKTLHELVEDWHNGRPESMQALMSYPSILDDENNRFPMVLYGSDGAVLGALLYHSASMILLQNRPTAVELAKNNKSLIWHARQICGIVVDNHEKGLWPYATQPLLLAGSCIMNVAEREKILEMSQLIQSKSGWKTTWCIDKLKLAWSLA